MTKSGKKDIAAIKRRGIMALALSVEAAAGGQGEERGA